MAARNTRAATVEKSQNRGIAPRAGCKREHAYCSIPRGLERADNRREADIEMVVRLADGDLARLPALATDLVANRVDAILAAGPPAVQAARGATATVPVIAVDLDERVRR